VSGLTVEAPHTSVFRSPRLPWVIALVGVVAMFLPTYWGAMGSIWQTDDNAHGALVFALVLWLFWRQRKVMFDRPSRPAPVPGAMIFGLGLLFYIYGRTLDSRSFEFLSPIFILWGALLVLRGPMAVAAVWFPIFYLLFTIPLPAVLVDTITGPLKQWISELVEIILYKAGYPIARSGVTISIGQYQLLVADACSGLHSMFSLAAIGTLFMYLMARSGRIHNAVMLASIIPIAFAANVVRVIALVLITYYFGDEAGQGFLHGAAGLLLMLFSLACLFAIDFGMSSRGNSIHGAR